MTMAGYLRTRVAYLQGLVEGLDISAESAQGRVLVELLDVMEDMAGVIEDIEQRTDELSDYLEEVDDDLEALEEEAVAEPVFVADGADDGAEVVVTRERCPECNQTLTIEAGTADRR